MSDLVERLRTDLVPHDVEALVEEAADEIERLTAEGTRKQERIDELEVRCQELGTLYEQWKETSHKQNELLDMYAERPSSESETIGWCKSCGSDNLELWMADGSAYVCKRNPQSTKA